MMAQLDPAARLVPQVVVLVNPLVVGLMAMLLILRTEDVPFINVKVWRTLVPTATLPALQEVGARPKGGDRRDVRVCCRQAHLQPQAMLVRH